MAHPLKYHKVVEIKIIWYQHRCLKIYLDLVLIRYGKVIDMNTTAFERKAYYLQFLRERGMPCRARPPEGDARGRQEAGGLKGNPGPAFTVVFTRRNG